MALSLYKFKQNKYWLFVFAISFGISFSVHLSLLPILLVAVYVLIKNRQVLDRKTIFIASLLFLLTVSPLIAFDYFHKGSNITSPIRILKAMQTGIYKPNIPYHGRTFFDSLGRVIYLGVNKNSSDEILYPCSLVSSSTRTVPPIIISLIVFILLFYFLTRRQTWKNENTRMVALLMLTFIVPFITSSFINPVEYYLLGFFPFLFLVFGYLTEEVGKNRKKFIYFSIAIISIVNLITILTAKGDYGFAVKRNLVKKVMDVVKDSPYSLTEIGECHKYEAWRYLFSVMGQSQVTSSEDNAYGWLYTDELSKKTPVYDVVIGETRIKNDEHGFKYSFEEGGFTGYIYERQNSK